jgi:hypothetical protein
MGNGDGTFEDPQELGEDFDFFKVREGVRRQKRKAKVTRSS